MAEIIKLGGSSFQPSAANTGNEQATILRGRNMMLRGSEGSFYFEVFSGLTNLNEDIPVIQLTGTISCVAGNAIVTGAGTLFKSELRFGQKILVGDQVFVVENITSDTIFESQRPADATRNTEEGYKLPLFFEIDNQRGTLIWGNAIKTDKGNIVAVGEGQLRINGAVLPGQSLIAERQIKLALFDPVSQNYSVTRHGFEPFPTGVTTIDVTSGGSRNMSVGFYSFKFAWANSRTGFGFSNPSEVVKFDTGGNKLEIRATNQQFVVDFTAALALAPTNADAIIIYRSLYADAAQNETQAGEGSWFVAKTVRIADLSVDNTTTVDVLDGELGTEVTFDNDLPPDADWVSFLSGDPVLIGCYGEATTVSPEGSSPGPFLVPSKRGNRDAFPAATAVPLSPPDTIIGFASGVGRLFLLTKVGLPFATATGQADFPITTRAFWQTGFKSPFGLVFVNDVLYAFTVKGVTRSISTGDVGSEQFRFAASIQDITRDWNAGYVHTVHDRTNEIIHFIYSAAERNEDGFWVSLCLPFYLNLNAFGPIITIEKPGRDMIVCGAANVGGKLQFLAGGRVD
jgi:hypothetical protein